MKQTILIHLLLNLIQKLQALIILLEAKLEAKKKQKGFKGFSEALGQRESGGDYKIVNVYGFLGKYQFGLARLCDLGYTDRKIGTTNYANSSFQWKRGYSQEYFLNTPSFQDQVFKEHCNSLIKQIKNNFFSYLGKTINGIEITLSGCVAGAHLGGIGGVRAFLVFCYDDNDAFGTRVSDYIKEFSGYNI